MKIEQVAVQLYTLRDFCKTAADYADALRKVREMGYKAIQISGVGPIPAAELRTIAEAEGLVICATHESGETILNEPAKVVAQLAALGTKYTAYPYPAGVDFSDPSHVENLIAKLDAAGAVLRAAGQVLTYHNHANEFFRVAASRCSKRFTPAPALKTCRARSTPIGCRLAAATRWNGVPGSRTACRCFISRTTPSMPQANRISPRSDMGISISKRSLRLPKPRAANGLSSNRIAAQATPSTPSRRASIISKPIL